MGLNEYCVCCDATVNSVCVMCNTIGVGSVGCATSSRTWGMSISVVCQSIGCINLAVCAFE